MRFWPLEEGVSRGISHHLRRKDLFGGVSNVFTAPMPHDCCMAMSGAHWAIAVQGRCPRTGLFRRANLQRCCHLVLYVMRFPPLGVGGFLSKEKRHFECTGDFVILIPGRGRSMEPAMISGLIPIKEYMGRDLKTKK
jgi:hypothetical protein